LPSLNLLHSTHGEKYRLQAWGQAMAETKKASRRARYKTGNSILNTYGYAIVGASLIQPLVMNGNTPGIIQVAGLLTGVFFHALAIYNAPKGEAA
jgi:hypothetical protein